MVIKITPKEFLWKSYVVVKFLGRVLSVMLDTPVDEVIGKIQDRSYKRITRSRDYKKKLDISTQGFRNSKKRKYQ